MAPLHKALLLGFVPYLLVFTVAINLLRAFGGDARAVAGYLKNVAYQVLLAYWVYAAWRRWPAAGRREPAEPAAGRPPA